MEQINNKKTINVVNQTTSPNPDSNQLDIPVNFSNEFEKIETIDKINQNQIKPQFDFYKDFEMRENLEKDLEKTNTNLNTNSINDENINENINEMNMMLNSFPIINENIRANIQLSVEIYKKINNFEINYIHNIINEKTNK